MRVQEVLLSRVFASLIQKENYKVIHVSKVLACLLCSTRDAWDMYSHIDIHMDILEM